MKKAVLIAAGLVIVAGVAVLVAAPRYADSRLNRVQHAPPYRVSAAARELHSSLVIVDLHADTLLWGRNINARSKRGHVDVPRLVDGNVAIQAFTVVTKVPRGQNIEHTADKGDMVKYLAVAEGWPPSTWHSPLARALHQAEVLKKTSLASEGRLTLILSKSDLDRYLLRRKAEATITAGFLGLEGAHALEGDINNIDRLCDAGFRMIAPTHFFDNDVAGSASGVKKGGLTDKGREMVKRAEAKHMLIDLAHASAKTVDDVTAIVTRPVIVSHTGVRGTCNNPRNLSDNQLRQIASTGGVVGIGYWRTATCGTDARAVARAIRHAANVIGTDHVALGSDFDGGVTQPFDTTGIPLITEDLMKEGLTNDQIRQIMGGNAVRILRQTLPD